VDKDLLATIIILVSLVITVVDFFAPFVVTNYHSSPVITGAFMTIAGIVAGFKWGAKKK
jgi:hypothetical protein